MKCAVSFCICLARVESQHCAVHQKDVLVHPSLLDDSAPAVTAKCDECGGTGDCQDCYGEGTHTCEHRNCYDEHECQTCDGSGECPDCGTKDEKDEPTDFDSRYLAFAFDAGWHPPQYIEWPWEVTA